MRELRRLPCRQRAVADPKIQSDRLQSAIKVMYDEYHLVNLNELRKHKEFKNLQVIDAEARNWLLNNLKEIGHFNFERIWSILLKQACHQTKQRQLPYLMDYGRCVLMPKVSLKDAEVILKSILLDA